MLNNRTRKSNACLCLLVVAQLLQRGSVTTEWSGETSEPAQLLDPRLLPWAASGAHPWIGFTCRPSRNPTHLPLPTGLLPQKGLNGSCTTGRRGEPQPLAAAVNWHRPHCETTPQESLQTPRERAHPFLQTHRRANKQHRGWQGKQRTKGQRVRIKPLDPQPNGLPVSPHNLERQFKTLSVLYFR